MLLSVTLVPIAFIMFTLNSLRNGGLYPRLGFKSNCIIAAVYCALAIFVSVYCRSNYMNLIWYRAGSPNMLDYIAGAIIFGLIMEFSRKVHPWIFYLNAFLIFYSVYGRFFPGIARHPGVSWSRVITCASIEIKTGVFGTYSEIGVGLIAAFLLILALLFGFGVQGSLVKTVIGTFGKRRSLVPQSAVVSSMAVATASGSGAANVVITGQYTIPLMKKTGFPPLYAGAVEASASMGGLLMPPVMAIAAFIMAEFLDVSYFDVIVRGYVVAIIYYVCIAFGVYLMTIRFIGMKPGGNPRPKPGSAVVEKITIIDKINCLTFFAVIALLIYTMGVLWWSPSKAAFQMAIYLLIVISALRIYSYKATIKKRVLDWVGCLRRFVEEYGRITSEIILLLATLGIMIGLFTVSGWLLKMGGAMMMIGEIHIVALIAVAFAVGIFLGLGLPPSATYILVAVIILPGMIKFGINPWVAHFFAFFMGVVSEYSPPTSLTAAVASRISGASFMRTMFETLRLSLPVFFLTFTIFRWPQLVVEPGLAMVSVMGLVAVGCFGVTCSIYGMFSKRRGLDISLRILGIVLGMLVLFYPGDIVSVLAAIILLPLSVFGLQRSRTLRKAIEEG